MVRYYFTTCTTFPLPNCDRTEHAHGLWKNRLRQTTFDYFSAPDFLKPMRFRNSVQYLLSRCVFFKYIHPTFDENNNKKGHIIEREWKVQVSMSNFFQVINLVDVIFHKKRMIVYTYKRRIVFHCEKVTSETDSLADRWKRLVRPQKTFREPHHGSNFQRSKTR